MMAERVTLTEDERRAERVALELGLKGVREGLAVLPARSPWVRCLREFRDGLGAQVGATTELARRGPPERDDLAG